MKFALAGLMALGLLPALAQAGRGGSNWGVSLGFNFSDHRAYGGTAISLGSGGFYGGGSRGNAYYGGAYYGGNYDRSWGHPYYVTPRYYGGATVVYDAPAVYSTTIVNPYTDDSPVYYGATYAAPTHSPPVYYTSTTYYPASNYYSGPTYYSTPVYAPAVIYRPNYYSAPVVRFYGGYEARGGYGYGGNRGGPIYHGSDRDHHADDNHGSGGYHYGR